MCSEKTAVTNAVIVATATIREKSVVTNAVIVATLAVETSTT